MALNRGSNGARGVDQAQRPWAVDGAGTGRPDAEVPERAKRRTFTAKYKLEILAAYDAAPDEWQLTVCSEVRRELDSAYLT
jgi:hypothetical protein